MAVSKIGKSANVTGNTNSPGRWERYALHNLLATGRDFNIETPEAFIEVLLIVYKFSKKMRIINKSQENIQVKTAMLYRVVHGESWDQFQAS